jgi:hypothetical protein
LLAVPLFGGSWFIGQQILNTFERKILRRIYGPTHEGGFWLPRWNNELNSLYNEPNIVKDIKIRRLRKGGSYNKDGRRKDSKKKGSRQKLPYQKTSGKTKN